MRKPAKLLVTASAIAALVGSLAIAPELFAAEKKMTPAQKGKKVAESRKKGNCFACHAYEGVTMPGNIGPPLVAMKARYPDKAKLRAQVWDATKANPGTSMPPFGRHEILSEKDIDYLVEWLYTL
ncbi:MAG: sulfur oxidation c-type cytochrome SoxX [Gammaproteobacteria bacterium]|nr:MAG: sulfur oxidation c-type cytochrome SoxX [Gammaproteobacteria bacterium]